MTQVFVLNSAYGLMTAVAAMDAGEVPPADGDRILLTVNAATTPETVADLEASPHLRSLIARFDHVESVGALVAPTLPTRWEPDVEELVLLERLLRRAWGIGDGAVELFLQSPQVAPALTVLRLFPTAPVTIIGDGLMTYAPLRRRLPHTLTGRVGSVVYADVVPGVTPLLLAGTARPAPLPVDRFRAVVDEVAVHTADADLDVLATSPMPTVLILGQYLAALGLMSAAEEQEMQRRMVDEARRFVPERIVFKPHPSAPPALAAAVADRAAQLGLAFETYTGAVPAEVVAARLHVTGVVAGFSTALPTLRALYGTPPAAVGTEVLLQRLDPYENSNRIPVTIVDALTRSPSPYAAPGRLQHLVDAVGFAMQPRVAASLRPRAETLLGELDAVERDRYFAPARLTELRLPGAPPPGILDRMLAASGSTGRLEQARLSLRGAHRRAGRAWKAVRGT
ncbi:polysialyltransferase family glycosyltransferase [Microbacterium sp. MC2]